MLFNYLNTLRVLVKTLKKKKKKTCDEALDILTNNLKFELNTTGNI